MASRVNTSERPWASARPISAASFSAAPDISLILPRADFVGASLAFFLGCVRLADSGARSPSGRVAALAAAVLGADINLVPPLDHLVFALLKPAFGEGFSGLAVILHAETGRYDE